MRRAIKQTLLTLAIAIGMTAGLLGSPMFTTDVHATGAVVGATVGSGLPSVSFGPGSGIGTSRETGSNMSGAASWARTGFYVTVSVASDLHSKGHAIGHGAVLKTQGGYSVPGEFANACPSQSRIPGASYGAGGQAPWKWPAFRLEGAAGYGGTTKSWLRAKNGTGTQNAVVVAEKFCGVPETEIRQHINAGETVFVNVEPIMWSARFVGNKKVGGQVGGLTYGVGSTYPEGQGKNFIGTVTHGAFPASFRYDIDFQGMSNCPDPGGRFSSAVMTNKNIGCGIVSVAVNEQYQVVICCEDPSLPGGWSTEYLGSGPDYEIVNPYNGYNFVEATFSTKKTDLTDPQAPYGTVCASGAPDRGVGVGMQHFNAELKEQALFIHYKGIKPPPTQAEAELFSWETAYLMPRYKAKRPDGAAVDNEYTLEEHIEEVIEEIKSKTKTCPDTSECSVHGTISCTGVVGDEGIDKVTCRGSTAWRTQKYGVRADLGKFPNANWNLYRQSVSGEKWDVFHEALNNVNRWQINKPVDPQFSYYLTRSHLEEVSISPDREGDGATAQELNIPPEFPWETSYIGKHGKEQQANSEGTHGVDSYDYTFTAYGYELVIEYHYWHEEEQCSHVDTGTNPDGSTYADQCTHVHPAHTFNEDGVFGATSKYEENEYTPDTWVDSAGGHKEDKYKTKTTPSGINEAAGQVVDEVHGTTLSGKWAKGTTFSYDPTEDQLVGSQFQGVTFTIYPEVAMSVWVSSDAERYTDPEEKLVYVMGEYPRHYIPPIAHSFKTSIDTGTMQGLGSLASAATGSATNTVPAYDLGVTAMGTTFEIATKSHYEMDIYTVGCNITDSPAHGEWGNEKTDVKGSHEEYVGSLLGGIKQEIIMKMDSSKFSGGPIFYTLLATEGKQVRSDDDAETSVFWHMGNYDEAGTVKGWCDTMWGLGADAYTGAFQYTETQILDTMFISNNDDPEDNKSKPYNPAPHVGSALGGILEAHGEHWYDEESKEKMKVEYYHTHIVFGLQNADDKVDYNLLTQQARSRMIDQSDNIHVSFYTRLFNPNDFSAADGYTWPHTGTFRVDELHNVDFSVINQTTSQMKK